MTTELPRIAIPEPTSADTAYNQRSLPQYIHAVKSAGGVAVPIPLHESPEVQANLLRSCSAVLLPGSGADVDPARYGQTPVKECAARDEVREAVDNLIFDHAFTRLKPVLGVCYGMQSLNVWRKGSLIQHLPGNSPADLPQTEARPGTQSATVVNHAPGRQIQDAHLVTLTPGSRLSHILAASVEKIADSSVLSVNSSHHQAVGLPGDRLTVAAKSTADGVIEALEGTDSDQFLVAVQWHPERSYDNSPASRALFSAFLRAARSWSGPESAVKP